MIRKRVRQCARLQGIIHVQIREVGGEVRDTCRDATG